VAGTFAGLPDGALLDIGSRSFRIRYEAGTGNDVALIRDDGSLRLNRPSMHRDGVFRVSGWGARSATYSVQLSTNLLDWIPVGTVSTDSGGLFDVSEQAAPEPSRQFYRILGP